VSGREAGSVRPRARPAPWLGAPGLAPLGALGVVACVFHCRTAAAEPTHQLHLLGGVGFSFVSIANEEINGSGSGVMAQAEYVYAKKVWVTPRAYSGLLFTTPDDDCDSGVTPCDVASKIWFLGGKVRLLAPIPYVAPFFELGVGASIGSLSTQVGDLVNVEHYGAAYHVPFALGIAFGEHRDFELSFHYLFHPQQYQFSGAIAFGVGFALSED
jgi:hypothetical protein